MCVIKKCINRYKRKDDNKYRVAALEREVDLLKGNLEISEFKSINPTPLKIILGAGNIPFGGWIRTNIKDLDITNTKDWEKWFAPSSIDNLLAEHVLEHLTEEQNRQALQCCFKYLKPSGLFRIAVPDGKHPDEEYLAYVRPPQDDHKILFTIQSLTSMLEEVGFEVIPLEYFNKENNFFQSPWDPRDGHIRRSAKFDKRAANRPGSFFYSSLIVDAIRPIK